MPTFDTPQPILVTIDIPGGHVRVIASDRADTVVEVRPTDEAEDADVQAAKQTQIDYADGQLSVTSPRSRMRTLLRPPPAIDVTVELPEDSRVEAKTWASFHGEGRLGTATIDSIGTIRLDQAGRVKLHTAAGDVSVARTSGHADVTTASGKIRIGEIDGTAVLKTSNGDITVGEATGELRLNTANGDIAVARALGNLGVKTAFGNIRVGELARGTAVLDTRFGGIEVGVPEGVAAWLDVSSRYGSVRSALEAGDAPEPAERTVEIRARTGYGDIVINRS